MILPLTRSAQLNELSCLEAPAEIFSGGPAAYPLSTGSNKTLELQSGFALGFKPEVNVTLFKKMLQFGRCVEQTNTIQVYHGQWSVGKAPSRCAFLQFSEKK